MTTIRHCSILEVGRGHTIKQVALGITRPLHATADVVRQTDIYKTLYCFYTTKNAHESTRSIRIYFEIFFKWSCIGLPICHKGVLSVILYRFC